MNKISRQEETKADHILRRHIYKTYEVNAFAEEWRNLPEIPSSSEIVPPSKTLLEEADEKYDHAESWNDYQQEPLNDENLPHNIVKGPWPSKEAYIGAHYQILREDAIAPLRRSVADVKKNPGMQEDGDTCIYTHVSGVTNVSIDLLTIVGDLEGTLAEPYWCCLPSGVLHRTRWKADPMATVKAVATRNRRGPRSKQ